ncbi:acyl carrier protein [Streptomyces sp. NA04227]|uniref:acyl carrier protein n=1 Tax=Streptomyces sp. NA04227 TaxID=2742136 RepID=UPI001591F047|nr:acyl carrier protein [Streptomyces sp. NA04227]QKW05052.1 acyl carrier protein [Streptomyces sp. NA04227]
MTAQLTYDELASLMKTGAGVTADPRAMEGAPSSTFADYGLDSLGLLGIVTELENKYGTSLPNEAETCATPDTFIRTVNTALAEGVRS